MLTSLISTSLAWAPFTFWHKAPAAWRTALQRDRDKERCVCLKTVDWQTGPACLYLYQVPRNITSTGYSHPSFSKVVTVAGPFLLRSVQSSYLTALSFRSHCFWYWHIAGLGSGRDNVICFMTPKPKNKPLLHPTLSFLPQRFCPMNSNKRL